jgi:hypothetical protein
MSITESCPRSVPPLMMSSFLKARESLSSYSTILPAPSWIALLIVRIAAHWGEILTAEAIAEYLRRPLYGFLSFRYRHGGFPPVVQHPCASVASLFCVILGYSSFTFTAARQFPLRAVFSSVFRDIGRRWEKLRLRLEWDSDGMVLD